jgi:integrase
LKKFLPASQPKATVADLLDSLETDYRVRERKSMAQALSHMKPIRERFGPMRAADVTGRVVDAYSDERQAAGVPNATINRGTQLLSQAYRREMKGDQPRVLSMPTIRRLPEKNARQGFFEPAEFAAVCGGLPDVLQDFARFIYLTAWRPGDLKALRWEMVDREAGTIRLPDSKNGKGKALAIVGDLATIMKRREQARLLTTKDGDVRVVEHVFHRDGQPIADYRDAWFKACKAAGFTYADPARLDPKTGKPREYVSKLLYDCKRSAIRNLVRNGVPERIALDVAGIKTRAILDRYNISSDQDKRAALEAVHLPIGEEACADSEASSTS